MVRMLLAGLAVLLLAGCSMYHPFNGSTGYSEAMIAPEHYQVSYVAPMDSTLTEATRLALVRAAELAVRSDYPYFVLEHNQGIIRTGTVDMPPMPQWYGYVYLDRHGRQIAVPRFYYAPGYIESYTQPETVIYVQLLKERKEGALDAKQVLADAVRDGIKISPTAAAKAGIKLPS